MKVISSMTTSGSFRLAPLAPFGRLPVSSSVVGMGLWGGEQRGQLSYNSLSSNFLQNPASQTGQQLSSDLEAKGPEVYI
jgi:hypothetical protein